MIPEASLEELGFDSLSRIDVQMACEDEFGLSFEDDLIQENMYVGSLVTLINSRVQAAQSLGR